MSVATPTPRPAATVVDRARLERLRFHHGGGLATTLHVARFPRAETRATVVPLRPARRAVEWCAGLGHAIVGGFFVRPAGTPLGEVRVDGRAGDYVPFASPWGGRRASVLVTAGEVAIAPRLEFPLAPAGDLLEAGPLLLRDGASVVDGVLDPEGFSEGAHQFDSDITDGRYPRAAMGINENDLIAVAADGRFPDEAGLTLDELADAMAALDARTAINLDGGGSTSLVFGGRLRNAPREATGDLISGGREVATLIAFEPRTLR
jgi:Phosphodiester glycosidase